MVDPTRQLSGDALRHTATNRQVDPLISDLPRLVFDSAVERPVFVGQAVIVVKCDQGPNFELYSGSFAFIPIVDDSGVFSISIPSTPNVKIGNGASRNCLR